MLCEFHLNLRNIRRPTVCKAGTLWSHACICTLTGTSLLHMAERPFRKRQAEILHTSTPRDLRQTPLHTSTSLSSLHTSTSLSSVSPPLCMFYTPKRSVSSVCLPLSSPLQLWPSYTTGHSQQSSLRTITQHHITLVRFTLQPQAKHFVPPLALTPTIALNLHH